MSVWAHCCDPYLLLQLTHSRDDNGVAKVIAIGIHHGDIYQRLGRLCCCNGFHAGGSHRHSIEKRG